MDELKEGIDALATIRKHEKILKDIEGILAIALEYPESNEGITGNKAWGLVYEAAYKIKELKEGIDYLAKRRNVMNEKDFNDLIASVKEAGAILRNEKEKNMTKVYIVIRQDYSTGFGIFCSVFFKRALAEDWIKGRRNPEDYNIETYIKNDDDTELEVF